MKKRCLILMASYNGEKYISEQIDSIISQTYTEWELIIRDDNSEDSTQSIIKRYCAKDSRIHYIENNMEKHGPYANFFALLEYARTLENFDYYFFSDQDDVWKKTKLRDMLFFAENRKIENVPLVVYADMGVINSNGYIQEPSINKVAHINMENKYNIFFVHSYLWGCNMMFNRALYEKIILYPYTSDEISIMSHDNYFGKWASASGNLLFFDKICMYHRMHESNVTDVKAIHWTFLSALKALGGVKDVLKNYSKYFSHTLFTIDKMHEKEDVPDHIEDIKNAITLGGREGIKIMKKLKVRRTSKIKTLVLYGIVLTRLYKPYMTYTIEN